MNETLKALCAALERKLAEAVKEREGLFEEVRRLVEEKEQAHRLNDILADVVERLRERNTKLEEMFRVEQRRLDPAALLAENKRLKKRLQGTGK